MSVDIHGSRFSANRLRHALSHDKQTMKPILGLQALRVVAYPQLRRHLTMSIWMNWLLPGIREQPQSEHLRDRHLMRIERSSNAQQCRRLRNLS